jgi:hypothetical protein
VLCVSCVRCGQGLEQCGDTDCRIDRESLHLASQHMSQNCHSDIERRESDSAGIFREEHELFKRFVIIALAVSPQFGRLRAKCAVLHDQIVV